MKRLLVNPELCTGCRLCQLACSFEHSGKFGLCESRVRVVSNELTGFSCPLVCLKCEEKYCEVACPVDAFRNGVIDESLCIGCRQCLEACPYGCIAPRPEGSPLKCGVCSDDPPCSRICPAGALRIVDDNLDVRYRLSHVGKEFIQIKKEGH